jgi:hypothetical protein
VNGFLEGHAPKIAGQVGKPLLEEWVHVGVPAFQVRPDHVISGRSNQAAQQLIVKRAVFHIKQVL